MNHEVRINNIQFIITKKKADLALIDPFGISLISVVLGLALSISRSIYRLKAIAAERAKIIHKITNTNNVHFKLLFV